MLIERGDVGGAVEHARRAVAAARAGADVLSVGVLASLAQALFFAGDLDETRRIALEAVERPDATGRPRRLRRKPRASRARRRRARAKRERGGLGSSGDRLRAREFPSGVFGRFRWPTLGLRWPSSTRIASTRPSERRCAASACDDRHSQPSVTPTPCWCSRRSASRARGLQPPPATSSTRAGRSRGFPIQGACRRSRQPSSRTSPQPESRAGDGTRRATQCAELAVLRCLATGLSRREIGAGALHLAEHREDPHPRAVSQAGRIVASGRGRARRGARSA